MRKVRVAVGSKQVDLCNIEIPLALESLIPGGDSWEVEVGFGRGRYLVQRAEAEPHCRFLGIEIASEYFHLVRRRINRRGLENVILLRGEALFILASVLPGEMTDSIHIYFPDPWPKARHEKRRLLDVETVDLVLRLLKPGGKIFFATDFLDYGERVREVLSTHPGVQVDQQDGMWPGGPRTNYEAKYEAEGRPILRLIGTWESTAGASQPSEPSGAAESLLHPAAITAIVSATS